MEYLDIRKEKGKTQRLTTTITRRVKEFDDLPEKLIVTKEQLGYLLKSKAMEVFGGFKKHPTEYLFYTPLNVMEIKVKRLWFWELW